MQCSWWKCLSEFLVAPSGMGSFDYASSSRCEGDAALRMTILFKVLSLHSMTSVTFEA